jgi:hypothetical protein
VFISRANSAPESVRSTHGLRVFTFTAAFTSKTWYAFLIGIVLVGAAALSLPSPNLAQGEAAEVRRLFQACTASGGVAASNYYDWVQQNGCKCGGSSTGSGKVTCDSSTTPSGTSTAPNPMVTFIQTYQKALEEARARQAAERNAATAYNNQIAAGASQDAAAKEDAAQDEDLAKYRARTANQAQANQDAFSNASKSAGDFLNRTMAASPDAPDPGHGSPAMKKAWKQLHCLAYVSRIAFVDLALNDLSNYHDVAAESSKAVEGSAMDVSCPAAPLPDLSGKNNVDMSKVSGKLKSDLDDANQMAQHLAQYHPERIPLPPLPPDVAADPQLAAAWKVQQAINAINDAPNPGKTPDEFAQIVKDRDKLRQSLTDANNAANGNFGSIQVDLTPASGASSGSNPQ